VDGQLDDVLACQAVGAGKGRAQAVVDDPASGIDHVTADAQIRWGRTGPTTPEHDVTDRDGAPTRQAHDGDAAAAPGGGDAADGVGPAQVEGHGGAL
jgi:hypothetical protein